jgi:hypothetical protein
MKKAQAHPIETVEFENLQRICRFPTEAIYTAVFFQALHDRDVCPIDEPAPLCRGVHFGMKL